MKMLAISEPKYFYPAFFTNANTLSISLSYWSWYDRSQILITLYKRILDFFVLFSLTSNSNNPLKHL